MNQAMYDKILPYTILRSITGSKLYGLNIDSSDNDQMGVVVEPVEMAMGFSEFEGLEYRTSEERSGVKDEPSGDGDMDVKLYSLRKFLRLCLKGNPTILELLFVPQSAWVKGDARGSHMQELAPYIVSRSCGKAFLGYLEAQRQRLTGERGGRHGKWRETENGYDTKYAMHMLRLGLQGIELLATGRISLPMQDEPRLYLRGVREGRETYQDVLTRAGELERELKDLLSSSHLDEIPNTKYVENWMLDCYWESWKGDNANPMCDLRARLGMKPYPTATGSGLIMKG